MDKSLLLWAGGGGERHPVNIPFFFLILASLVCYSITNHCPVVLSSLQPQNLKVCSLFLHLWLFARNRGVLSCRP